MADVQRGKEARGKKKHIEVNGADLMRGTAGGALSHGVSGAAGPEDGAAVRAVQWRPLPAGGGVARGRQRSGGGWGGERGSGRCRGDADSASPSFPRVAIRKQDSGQSGSVPGKGAFRSHPVRSHLFFCF